LPARAPNPVHTATSSHRKLSLRAGDLWRALPPFDIEREKKDPTWGDPSFRIIPASSQQDQVRVSHLHYNPEDVLKDFNILLPIDRFRELAANGEICGLASEHYSFMGFQGYPPDAALWQSEFGPQIASRMKAEDVQCVLLTPA
jgi:D-proline reductase (dithiol) PrdB